MRITIEIECDNAAFDGGCCAREVFRMLDGALVGLTDADGDDRSAARMGRERVRAALDGRRFRGINGNTVGGITVTP